MKRNAFPRLAALLLCGAAAGAQAEIYTWIDDNGVTHYSTSRPPGQAGAGLADPRPAASRPATRPAPPPFAAPAAPETPEAQALRNRVETLESLLDQERGARVSDLREQLANERDRVRRLEAERAQAAEAPGLWNSPLTAPAGVWWNPAPVIVLPRHHVKPGKREPRRIEHDRLAPERIPYPSISGPSSNLR